LVINIDDIKEFEILEGNYKNRYTTAGKLEALLYMEGGNVFLLV